MSIRSPRTRRLTRTALVLLAAFCGAWVYFPPPPNWVEAWYSRGLYRWVLSGLVPVADSFPFSLSALVMAIAGACLLGFPFVSWRRWRRSGAPVHRVLRRWAECGAFLCAGGYAFFIVVWGAGYRRERFEHRLDLVSVEVTEEDVDRWITGLTHRIEEDLPDTPGRDVEGAIEAIRDSMGLLCLEWEGSVPALPRSVKRLPAGALLAFGTSGVTSPFLVEAHVDGGETDTAFISIGAHEMAHVAGYCSEADADFVAAMAALRAKHPHARYAMGLELFRKFAAALPASREADAYAALPQAAREDLREMDRVVKKHVVPKLASVHRQVYETYLRTQGLEQGMREYSMVVKLIIAAERLGMVGG